MSDFEFDDEPSYGSRRSPQRSSSGEARFGVHISLLAAGLMAVGLVVGPSMLAARARLTQVAEKPKPSGPVAAPSDLGFCTDGFKQVLRRVLDSCGLLTANSRRGCTPSNLKQVAAISDEDFNALFLPVADRAAILEFDAGKEDMSPEATTLLEKKWSDSKGASVFLVVARASPEGSTEFNQALSHKRANSVLYHLDKRFKDPELEQKVGLLWLGEEYAQLSADFCKWEHGGASAECTPASVNRSAFVSWIDCQL